MKKKNFAVLVGMLAVCNLVVSQTYYFTVSSNKRVVFSPGNLQYNAALGTHECADGTVKPGTWRFAEHQYDVWIDNNVSEDYDGWINMFSWGTSGYDGKNPWGTVPSFANENVNISDTYYDWGIYNSISNGDNVWNWRTLSSSELITLMQRDNSWKGGRAYVDGKLSVIFIPDNADGWTSEGTYPRKWILKADETIKFVSALSWNGDRFWNTSKADSINVYTKEQWNLMEQAGTILLPYANTSDNTGKRYWTTTTRALSTSTASDNGSNAVCLQGFQVRVYGEGVHSKTTKAFVRLVKDYQYKISATSSNASLGSVQLDGSDDGWFNVGATATVRAIPNGGNQFLQWSDGSIENPRTFSVNEPVTLTAEFASIETFEIPSIEANYGDDIPLVYLPQYFKVSTSKKYSLEVHSSNDEVVYPVIMGDNLGFIQYGAGTAEITVVARVASMSATQSFNVTIHPTKPDELCNITIVPTITNVTCYKATDGKIEISAEGGTEPYRYLWSTGRTSNGIFNVARGVYSVLVTDANGCSVSDTFNILEPNEIQFAEITVNEPTCAENNGSITASVSGGIGSYLIEYEYDAETDSYGKEELTESVVSMTNLQSGTYKIRVSDQQYKETCWRDTVITLSDKGAPSIALVKIKPSKCNTATGYIEVANSGGQKPYSVHWSDMEVVPHNEKRANLPPGLYTLTVADANNCKAVETFEIEAIPFLQPEIALVSYGENSHCNIIVWQKESTNDIEAYNIYREKDRDGDYELIGSLNYGEPSVFVDENADHNHCAYRYRLSAKNSCYESPLSREAKTVNLKTEGDTIVGLNFSWDAFEGIPYIKYCLYGKHLTGRDLIVELPYNTTSYFLPHHQHGIGGYYIGIKLASTIDITKLLKAEGGPFTMAFSNIAEIENAYLSISDTPESTVDVFAKDKSIIISNADGNNVFVFDVEGKLVAQRQNVDSAEIPVKTAGVYVVIVGKNVFKVMVN